MNTKERFINELNSYVTKDSCEIERIEYKSQKDIEEVLMHFVDNVIVHIDVHNCNVIEMMNKICEVYYNWNGGYYNVCSD